MTEKPRLIKAAFPVGHAHADGHGKKNVAAGPSAPPLRVSVHFYSYFKELTGCADTTEALADGSTMNDLLQRLIARFPKLAAMQNSTLLAVGVEYQSRSYVLREGEEVSLFPPVQGG